MSYLTSADPTGVLPAAAAGFVGTDVTRGFRQECAWQGTYNCTWHCENVPNGTSCAWITNEAPAQLSTGATGVASPASVRWWSIVRLPSITSPVSRSW